MPSKDRLTPPTILIVDEDLGFVLWLGLTLTAAGYMALPMTSVAEAVQILDELPIMAVDLLILSPTLEGAAELMETLRSRQGHLQVIRIDDRYRQTANLGGSGAEWIARVRKALQKTQSAGPVS